MRTTIDIPDALLSKAIMASAQKTKRAVLIEALESYLHQKKKMALLHSAGKISMKLDVRAMRRNRDLG